MSMAEAWFVLRQLKVGLGQFLDVNVLERDDPHVLDKTGRAVHVPDPRVPHGDLEVDLAVIARPHVELDVVGQIEPAFGLDHMREQPDYVAVLPIELQLHLGLILLKVLRAHESILLSSAQTTPGGLTRRTLTKDRRCSGQGPCSSSARTCSSVEYPL